uniref:Uncharacterized protein n=2 Tax=Rhizophora mucronata TaxID=61149 RepID=A0A2P2JMK1_RHIMU
MDYRLSTHKFLSLQFFPSTVQSCSSWSNLPSNFVALLGGKVVRPPAAVVVAKAGSSHCDASNSSSRFSLNTPLEPRSVAGKYLSSVFQNQKQFFHAAAADELKLLANERDEAISRMFLSAGSDEASLHKRIAQLKEEECQTAVEDVMYILILYRFSEVGVPLVPKLSRCAYNGRLEIWPSKVWELESIHSLEVLEMVREHVSALIGLRVNSSVTDNWATTEIQQLYLGQVYAASVFYGYFLKSVSLRHRLEQCLAVADQDIDLDNNTSFQFPGSLPCGFTHLFGLEGNLKSASSSSQDQSWQEWKCENFKCFMMGFDTEALESFAKPKSKEAVNLIEKHSRALFGDEMAGLVENDKVILTSFLSLRRLVLEAVAFGSFLWDTEEYVNSVFKLKVN